MPLGYNVAALQGGATPTGGKKRTPVKKTKKPELPAFLQQIGERLTARAQEPMGGRRRPTPTPAQAPARPTNLGMNEAARYAGRKVVTQPGPGASKQDWIDYALQARPSAEKGSIAFNPDIPRSGQEFMDYMLNQGVAIGGFNLPPGAPVSGKYTDWLLGRLGLTSYGINPYARPSAQVQQQAGQAGGGGGGYGGYPSFGGGGGGGGGARIGRGPLMPNAPRWLQSLVTWRIGG